MTENYPPFYVGQDVVAVVTATNSSGYGIKEGDQYKVLGLRKRDCCTGIWIVDIGVRFSTIGSTCPRCNTQYNDSTMWVPADMLVPITSTFQAITFEKAIKEQLMSIN